MPRTATPYEGETFAQFLQRLGIEVDAFYSLNPTFNASMWEAGRPFSVPDTAQVFAPKQPTSVVSSVSQAPVSPPGENVEATLPKEQWGAFQEMLKNFNEAWNTFLSAPGFIKSPGTAKAGAEAGKGAGPGWTRQEAEFLRSNQPYFEQRFSEQVMRQYGETGQLPSLTAAEFLKTIKPREEMEMRSAESPTGRPRVPSLGVRRLRF